MSMELLLMIVRKVITIGGAVLVSRGTISDTWMDPELISGVALLIASLIWSNANRKKVENAASGGQ